MQNQPQFKRTKCSAILAFAFASAFAMSANANNTPVKPAPIDGNDSNINQQETQTESNKVKVEEKQVSSEIETAQNALKVAKEALQKTLFPSRIEQNCSVRFFFTTSKNGVFFAIKIV